ncbi:MAG TPA: hypothetical protein VM661_01710 [Candidatus Sulfotelmatobacter sp.]|jgi:hypothetical protein|nr:hypothetical protein [Candidatus Sulfotelmatobacter sp.]
MKHFLTAAAVIICTSAAFADESSDCATNAGSYLSGIVTRGPTFQGGKEQKGVELSHTHVTIKGDKDGKFYDVAMDNVFAGGYAQAGEHVPSPLSGIAKGDRLGLCGRLYSSGDGIHWVHANCGKPPVPGKPNGSVKKLDADGNPTTGNLEDNTQYCKLWN